MGPPDRPTRSAARAATAAIGALLAAQLCSTGTAAQETGATSYMPVVTEDFQTIFKRDTDERAQIKKRQADLLESRYDLGNHPAKDVMMSGGRKPVQDGVRVKLAGGATWEKLAETSPDEIRDKSLFPPGFLPAAACQAQDRRHGVSREPDQGDRKAGGPIAEAVRCGVRSARAPDARVSAAAVPDHPPRSRRLSRRGRC